MNQDRTFKLVFAEDDIRRITLSNSSWEAFNQQLVDLYPDNYHPELTIRYRDEEGDLITVSTEREWDCMLTSVKNEEQPIRLYISEGKNTGQYFKDGPPPTSRGFYTATPTTPSASSSTSTTTSDSETETEKITISGGESLRKFELEVPKCLSRFFPSGKILPYNIPTWLQGCVEIKRVPGPAPVVDMDIDIYRLFDLLNEQAVSMIGPEKEPAVLSKAKEFLQSMIELVPNHPIAHYNMACAQSLLGEVKEAIDSLHQAIMGGYNDVKHMIQDTDLENVRNRMSAEFQNLVALATGGREKKDNKEAHEEGDWIKMEPEEPEEKQQQQETTTAVPCQQEESLVVVKEEKSPASLLPEQPPQVTEEKKVEQEEKPKVEEKKQQQQQFTGKWAQQQEALAAMGFTVVDVNKALLDHYKGDLVKVVNALLNQ